MLKYDHVRLNGQVRLQSQSKSTYSLVLAWCFIISHLYILCWNKISSRLIF